MASQHCPSLEGDNPVLFVHLDQAALSCFSAGCTSCLVALGEGRPEEGIICLGSAQTTRQELTDLGY